MTSGQMWNHIRGPPYAHKNPQTGQVVSQILKFHRRLATKQEYSILINPEVSNNLFCNNLQYILGASAVETEKQCNNGVGCTVAKHF